MTNLAERTKWGLALALVLPAVTSLGIASPYAHVGAAPAPVLRVSPTGNDATCARGDLTKPCAGFNRAYQLARPGDIVEVAGGTYPTQNVIYRAGRAAPNVVFREARGATAAVRGTLHIGDNTGNSNGWPAQFVTFDGIDIDRAFLHYEGDLVRPRDITFQNLHLGTKQETGLFAASTLNLRLVNVEFGPTCCEEDGAQIAQGSSSDPQPSGTVLERVRFHDIRNSCRDIPTAVWPNCDSESKPFDGNHVDCLQSTGGDNWAFRRSQFVNCQTGVQLGAEKGRYWNMTVENSYFEGFHPFKISCGGPCPGYAFRARTQTGKRTFFRLYYNTLASGLALENFEPGGAYELVGNIVVGPSNNGGLCNIRASDGKSDARFSKLAYNVFTSGAAACGRTNVNASPSFMNTDERAGPIDLRLRARSPGIGAGDLSFHPRADIEGKLRPLRWRPDAGAWQHETAVLVPGRSLGAIALGMSRAAVESVYGRPASRTASTARFRRTGGFVAVTFDSRGRVAAARTTSRYFATAGGIGVRAEVEDVPARARWSQCRGAFVLRRGANVTEFGAARENARRVAWVGIARLAQARCR